ncbi:electron transport complex subunit RsxG [Shewanella intestini]|uniref:Ion-translocating oxidoreductase complex subunit G n=1 Tax=Shewanella intestini TaxID=2017544 RepID=A0ABS5I4N8_9GAMM|nr:MULTISPECIES: electron transport complex subunit RsxG [Shewanella]MBR9728997.1 electron transport complex subunit RsxG [Shewanella intestini]MRG36937.1 electron transport complex subunit RsxG [Shewanella sp. XMDDZSB0408]
MIKNGLILAVFALFCTGIVALVNSLTADRIQLQQQQQLTQTLAEIIPTNLHDNRLIDYCILVHDPKLLGTDNSLPAYIATKDNRPVAMAIETIAPDGYNGDIKIVIGVDNNNKVLGVRTLAQNETPGLGDQIDTRKSDWVKQFTNWIFDIDAAPLKVKKDGGTIDQFTGATITPRAYVGAINRTLKFVDQNRKQLYLSPIDCEANNE